MSHARRTRPARSLVPALLLGMACSCSKVEARTYGAAKPQTTPSAAPLTAAGAGDPETPLLDSVPVGAWAEYETRAAGLRIKQVMALVQRTQDGGSVLETGIHDAQNPRAPRVTTRELFSPASHVGDPPGSRAVQVDGHDPMEYPSSERPRDAGLGLKAFGPQTYVTTETITVIAGTYAARKFVVRQPDGSEATLWLDHRLYPLGIVKMQFLPPSRNPGEGSVMELARVGDGARPTIVKRAVPFDSQTYGAQMTAGALPSAPPGLEAATR